MVPGVVVLIVAGLQVPMIAGVLVEPAGSKGAGLSRQSGPIAAKVGVICAVVSIFIATSDVQEFPVAVKV